MTLLLLPSLSNLKRPVKTKWQVTGAGSDSAPEADLKLVKVADAARDNWDFLSHQLPKGHDVIDFYHATAHLQAALEAAYGEASQKAREQGAKLRDVLLEDPGGVEPRDPRARAPA